MFHKSKFFYIFRQRSLNPTNEYHSCNSLLKEKKVIVFSNEQLFFNERSAIHDWKTTIIYLWLSIILAYFANNEEIPVHPIYIYMVCGLLIWPAYRLCEDVIAGQTTGY